MALRVLGALVIGLELCPVVSSAQRPSRQPPSVSTVEIAPTDATVRVGQQQVFLVYAFDRANRPVSVVFSFSSSNRNVARVDSTGIAVGVAPGTALITARTGTGASAKSATTILTVVAAEMLGATGYAATTPGEPSRPGGPDGTLVIMGDIPTGARVTVDGRATTLRAKLPAGRHRLRVEATGFQRYEAQVDVRSNAITVTRVGLVAAPGLASVVEGDCASPQAGLQNRNNTCYDVRPGPRTPPAFVAPASCTGTTTPASVLLRVDAVGNVETVSMLIRSNCAAFTELALAFARDLIFTPASKNGRFVSAWLSLPVRPLPK